MPSSDVTVTVVESSLAQSKKEDDKSNNKSYPEPSKDTKPVGSQVESQSSPPKQNGKIAEVADDKTAEAPPTPSSESPTNTTGEEKSKTAIETSEPVTEIASTAAL